MPFDPSILLASAGSQVMRRWRRRRGSDLRAQSQRWRTFALSQLIPNSKKQGLGLIRLGVFELGMDLNEFPAELLASSIYRLLRWDRVPTPIKSNIAPRSSVSNTPCCSRRKRCSLSRQTVQRPLQNAGTTHPEKHLFSMSSYSHTFPCLRAYSAFLSASVSSVVTRNRGFEPTLLL